MTADNSSADTQTPSNTTKTVFDYSTGAGAFIDPALQLAIAIEFYFQYAVIAIGIFGIAANALVLYALISYHAREVKKRAVNLLMINQNLLDLFSCIVLVITFLIRVGNIQLAGSLGYFLCIIFISETSANSSVFGSIINLMAITAERYLKVVHPFWSKKHLKRWIIYAAMVFAWVGGILMYAPVAVVTTVVYDGVCLPFFLLKSPADRMIMMACGMFGYVIIPVIMFVYCYSRIVLVMKRQMRVMAAHNAEGSAQISASQMQSKRTKWNIIKTMTCQTCHKTVNWIYFVFAQLLSTVKIR